MMKMTKNIFDKRDNLIDNLIFDANNRISEPISIYKL